MLIINYSLQNSIIALPDGQGQTDKKLIMNIDVKRMSRGHAIDTFFLPHDTSQYPCCSLKETWA